MKKENPFHKYIRYSTLGFQFLGFVVFGFFIGRWLNKSTPFYAVIGATLGAVAAIIYLIVRYLRNEL